jgi:type IV pilus assembly protein PilW
MREDQPVSPVRQQGLSLVELMIALTIGMVLAIVATQAYMSASTAQSSQTDLTRIQESARFAFDLFAREARLAGYRNNAVPGDAWLSFDTSQATTSYIAGTNDPATVDLGGGVVPTVLNLSDTITFRYYGHDNNAVPPDAADGSILDCQGNAIRRADLLSETIYVAADAANNNEPTLFCGSVLTTAGGTVTRVQVPLIPGIESVQILYGEDTDGDGVINRYIPINAVTDRGNIKAVWVSAVIRGPGSSVVAAQTQTFNHFGLVYAPLNVAPGGDGGSVFAGPNDARPRRVISTVVALRNNL